MKVVLPQAAEAHTDDSHPHHANQGHRARNVVAVTGSWARRAQGGCPKRPTVIPSPLMHGEAAEYIVRRSCGSCGGTLIENQASVEA